MFIRSILLLLCLTLGAFASDFSEVKTVRLLKLLYNTHYSPPPLNQETEKKVIHAFVDKLDPNRTIFTMQQIDSLINWYQGILDTNSNTSADFLKKVSAVYKRRLVAADSMTVNIGRKPIQFIKTDSLTYSNDIPFSNTDETLEQRRTRNFKFRFLIELYSIKQETEDSLSDINTLIKKNEQGIRKQLVAIDKCYYEKIYASKGFDSRLENSFLSAIANTFDPHSEYFSVEENNSFTRSLSSVAGTMGLNLSSKEGKIVVSNISPGGPAWKTSTIHAGDELLKISSSTNTIEDLTCVEPEEVEELLNNSKDNSVEIEVKNSEGKIQKVKLVKQQMRVDENKVNSCILKGKKNVGYISLPDFYTFGEYSDMPGCANDVAKEILTLKQTGIDGLILDLRYNGGGSLKEAIDLAGIFIDVGPMGIIKTTGQKPVVLKDLNRGTAYDGSVVMLINGMSASATEMLAGVLQDYNRAIIVGQNTYGKATGQEVIPLNPANENDGYIKVTDLKIYRVNGESNQRRGVVPDIRLPDLYDGALEREEDNENALVRDTIMKKIVFNFPEPLPVEQLRKQSALRVNASDEFREVIRRNKKYFKKNSTVSFPLQPENVFDWFENFSYDNEDTTKSKSPYLIENNTFDKKLMAMDEYKKDFIEASNEQIENDISIHEAYEILNDLNELTRKK